MSGTAKRATSNALKALGTVFTAGEEFADGTIIELVSSPPGCFKPDLLVWNGKRSRSATRAEHDGHTYEALEMDPRVYDAIRFPNRCENYGSACVLFDEMRGLFHDRMKISEADAARCTCVAMTSWLVDRSQSALALALSCSDENRGIDALRLLACLCRRPLLLAELTSAGFRSLPMHLQPTLLIDQQHLGLPLQRLLCASNHRGLHVPGNAGQLLDVFGAKAIFSCDEQALDALGPSAIRIFLGQQSSDDTLSLDDSARNQIADRFQPRLLMFRLRNLVRPRKSGLDLSKFTPAMRPPARTIADCFAEDPRLARDAVQLLEAQDQELRAQRYLDPQCAALEVLITLIHQGKPQEIQVDELTRDVNTLLWSRGEFLEYRPEEMGWRLRAMKLPRHTDSSGRKIILGREMSLRIHQLARDYDLLTGPRVRSDCSDCQLEALDSKVVM